MRRETLAFLIMQGLGGAGQLAMLVTALLSAKVVRSSTWLNFSATWVIYVISYILLYVTVLHRIPSTHQYT